MTLECEGATPPHPPTFQQGLSYGTALQQRPTGAGSAFSTLQHVPGPPEYREIEGQEINKYEMSTGKRAPLFLFNQTASPNTHIHFFTLQVPAM